MIKLQVEYLQLPTILRMVDAVKLAKYEIVGGVDHS